MRLRLLGILMAGALVFAGCDDTDSEPRGAGGEGGEGGQPGDVGPGGDDGGQGGMGGIADMEPRDVFVGAPQCSDGEDNDDDGLIDLEDPGCDNALDVDERQLQCADGVDNDDDGLIDFPDDPGCGSRGDNSEINPPVLPECADGLDNDRNGYIDEQDPGCISVADTSESPPDEVAQCSNRIDDDGDGVIDFPLEPGCSAAGDDDEANPFSPTACNNGMDDDGDGLVDYPSDPGCFGVGDRDEADKPVTPACADGQDNDRDGRTDWPDDEGCYAASDASEKGTCLDRYDPPVARDGVPIVVDTSAGIFQGRGTCGGQGSPEVVLSYRLERRIEALEISTIGPETVVPTSLYVRFAECLLEDAEVGCQREAPDEANPGHVLRIDAPAPGEYFVFVDGVAGAGGRVSVTVTEVPLAQCLNGADDDEDGLADYPQDPGCARPDDRDETTEALTACSNDEDDDGDGAIDYPQDVGCIAASSNSEVDLCGAGVRIHEIFPGQTEVFGNTDPEAGMSTNALNGGCGRAGAPEVVYLFHNPFNARLVISTAHPETLAGAAVYLRSTCTDRATELACDDGSVGGAGSGRIQVRAVPRGDYFIVVDSRTPIGGAFKLTIDAERDDPECDDFVDNDNDGLVDADDPGCTAPGDTSERDLARIAQCNNGIDDDGDNRIDWPLDPGCEARGDESEADPAIAPQCLNRIDDDEDGLIDFPNDPGCAARGDRTEEDGRIPPACSNGEDDDGDGDTDYPDDLDCLFAGDPNEDR
ncbi:MAG: hypothetical protein R3F65_13760 [bacterium]